jgi:hypothetical protein
MKQEYSLSLLALTKVWYFVFGWSFFDEPPNVNITIPDDSKKPSHDD